MKIKLFARYCFLTESASNCYPALVTLGVFNKEMWRRGEKISVCTHLDQIKPLILFIFLQ